MQTRLKSGTTIPRNLPGRIVLLKSNTIPGGPFVTPTEIEWFDCSSIKGDEWVVPETVNGFYYVLEN